MPKKYLLASTGLALMFSVSATYATDTGVDRAVNGAVNTVTSPGKIVEGISEDATAHGPIGVVTGSVKGGVRAAGQAVTGAANLGVGIVEAVTEPLTR